MERPSDNWDDDEYDYPEWEDDEDDYEDDEEEDE